VRPTLSAEDAYTKYQSSDNPLLVFYTVISKTSGEDDALFLHNFIIQITGISKFYIKPAIDKLFK
jgi:hypothetical protein